MLEEKIVQSEITAKLIELADEFVDLPEKIEVDDNILELGILDSLGVVSFLDWFGKHYNITLGPEEITIDNLGTINKMMAFIKSKRNLL